MKLILSYLLVKFNRRLVFDVLEQDLATIHNGSDSTEIKFVAANGYEVISRSRQDIHTERIWLRGARWREDDRAGTMVYDNNLKRDQAFAGFTSALNMWAAHNNGIAVNASPFGTSDAATLRSASIWAETAGVQNGTIT